MAGSKKLRLLQVGVVHQKIFSEQSELESFLDSIIDCEDFNAEGSLSLDLKIIK
jgi:hypothetical protein